MDFSHRLVGTHHALLALVLPVCLTNSALLLWLLRLYEIVLVIVDAPTIYVLASLALLIILVIIISIVLSPIFSALLAVRLCSCMWFNSSLLLC